MAFYFWRKKNAGRVVYSCTTYEFSTLRDHVTVPQCFRLYNYHCVNLARTLLVEESGIARTSRLSFNFSSVNPESQHHKCDNQ